MPNAVDTALDPSDNLAEFGSISDQDLDYFEQQVCAAQATGYAIVASFGGTSFGDVGLNGDRFPQRFGRQLGAMFLNDVQRDG